MKVKEESEKTGLKLSIQKTKIMASGSITSWQIDGETMGTVTDFIFLGSKITAVGDCSHEIKRCLLLWRKAVTNLDSILKKRETKFCIFKAIVFPVVMYGCEIWIIEKAREFQKNIYFCFIDYVKAFVVWITTNWKILEEMGISYHLTCLLRNPYAGQEATVRTGHGTTDWLKVGKGVCQGCI